MLRPVVVTAAAVWATCTKQQAVYKEATREGGLFCLLRSSLLSLAGRLVVPQRGFPREELPSSFRTVARKKCNGGSPRIHAGELGFQAERLA